MTEEHPRLAFAVLGGVVAALVALAFLILRTGDAAGTDLSAEIVPATVAAPSPVNLSRAGTRTAVRRGVDPAWVAAVSARAGIPGPALRAYADAELLLAKKEPACHLGWNTLAGIGWVESQHGTIDGRTLLEDGRSSKPVIGPALDGTRFAAIASTPRSERWHGDARWEHAVGPMQFIASSWDKWGADGDGDGVADPLDIDDAAYTTARYLCADAHDLATATGWNAAIHSYNHDDTYVASVLAAANTYASRSAS